MLDKPSGAALLDVARRSLLDEVALALEGRPRYVALMVANAIGIVSREIEQSDRSGRAWNSALSLVEREDGATVDASIRRLAEAIRAGRHDADPTLYGALLETAEVAADIWKPGKPIAG